MAFPRVKTCCGCSLRTGSLVIAWVQTICAIGNLTLRLSESIEYSDIVNIIIYLFQLTFGIVLLYGTKWRLPAYVKAYVIFGVAAECIAVAVIAPSIFYLILENMMIGGIVLAIILHLFTMYSYALVVVYSFNKEILEVVKQE